MKSSSGYSIFMPNQTGSQGRIIGGGFATGIQKLPHRSQYKLNGVLCGYLIEPGKDAVK